MTRRLRLLSIATLFPNPRMPVHAQFVKQRLDALAKLADVTVISPIPWFPGEQFIPRYANRHRVPPQTDANPYPTFFPKYFSIPAILKPLEGFTLAWCVARILKRQRWENHFDVFDCHLGFPEGFAGYWLSKWFGKPYVVTLRGHDINDLPRFPVRIRQVIFGLRHAARYFGVAQALVDGAIGLGAPPATGFRSSNGVDPSRFFPLPKTQARTGLGLNPDDLFILSVGHLVRRKGTDILIRAVGQLRKQGLGNLKLIIVGKGGEEGDCESEWRALAAAMGLEQAVVWAGAVANADLVAYYSVADVFCLASEKEGWPNVLLEALACGTPVVASNTWGVPEILSDSRLGIVVDRRSPETFADALSTALKKSWDASALVEYAARQTWDQVAESLLDHFHAVVTKPI